MIAHGQRQMLTGDMHIENRAAGLTACGAETTAEAVRPRAANRVIRNSFLPYGKFSEFPIW